MQPEALIKELPHRRMEAWKWSDIGRSVKADQLGLITPADMALTLPQGVNVSRETLPAKDTAMGRMAARFDDKVQIIEISDGQKIKTPLVLRSQEFGHKRIAIRLGSESSLTVYEMFEGGETGFSNTEISYELAKGAKLTRMVLQADNENTTRIITAHITMWGKAELEQFMLSFGAGLSRLETRLAVMGKDVKCFMGGAYLLSGKAHSDMTSYIDLSAPTSLIRQSVKGVVTDNATGVFQGKFHVRRPAQFTDAKMRHDALMLSDMSHVRAKPELEIYADDVACAHGNTLGQLDESALFYMCQRGIPKAQARALLMQAFIADVFVNMQGNTDFMARIENWLEQNS